MRVSFQVSMFRNVLDSTVVPVQHDVTCLVGKNESGKTAMLQALYRLNPVYSETFRVQDDYPRWRLVSDRRKKLIDDMEPVRATFDLQETDVAAVESELGPRGLTARTFSVVREYGRPDQLLHYRLPAKAIDGAAALSHLIAGLDHTDAAAEHLSRRKRSTTCMRSPPPPERRG